MKAIKIKKGVAYKLPVGILLCAYTILFFSLIAFAFINSFKDDWGFILDAIGLPETWHFENYVTIFNRLKMQQNATAPVYYIEAMFGGSLLYACLAAGGTVVATTLMAYACAQFPCKMASVIYFIAMFIITVPIIGALPSEMKVIRSLNFYNNITSTLFLKFQFGNVYFLLLFESMRRIPKDYSEAAAVDGASLLRIMLQIMLPMVGNILGSVFLVLFVAYWNDYSTPVMYFPHYPNLAVGLIDFAFSTSGEIATEPFKLGACMVAMIPMTVIFSIFSGKLIGGISAGGIKG